MTKGDQSMNEDTKKDSAWEMLSQSAKQSEGISDIHRSFSADVWFRFKGRTTNVIGLVLIVLVLLFATIGPFFTGHDYDTQELQFANVPPRFDAFLVGDDYVYISNNYKPILVSEDGELLESLPRIEEDLKLKQTTYEYGDTFLIVDFSTKTTKLLDANGVRYKSYVTMWNETYKLGTDSLGRDLLTRLMMGARISLLVAFIAGMANLIIGVLYGGISAYLGGNVDGIMMRIVDIVSTIPLTLYVILIMVVLDSGMMSIVIALGSVYWVTMARVVRGQVLSLKEKEYVYAAQTMGTSTYHILIKHLIPNTMGPIIVTLTMLIPSAMFIESFMSFIGLGVSSPMASWGTMCNDAISAMNTSPYQLFAPSAAICITMFGFNFVGDGLRDALDPKLRE